MSRRGLAGLALAALALVGVIVTPHLLAGDRIHSGVTAAGVDLGGMSVEEAAATLAAAEPATPPTITVTDPATTRTWTHAPAQLGVAPDPVATAARAHAVGRSGVMDRLVGPVKAALVGTEVPLEWHDTADAPALEAIIEAATVPPRDARLERRDGVVVSVPAVLGRAVDREATVAAVMAALSEGSSTVNLAYGATAPRVRSLDDVAAAHRRIVSSPVTLRWQGRPVLALSTDELEAMASIEDAPNPQGDLVPSIIFDRDRIEARLEALAAELAQPPIDARFQLDPETRRAVVLRSGQPGLALDVAGSVDRVIDAAYTQQRTGELAAFRRAPDVTPDVASALDFPIDAADAFTRLAGVPPWRRRNMETAADALQGIALVPGQEVSLAAALGEVSDETGYLVASLRPQPAAPPGFTGGLEQVATTYLRAIALAGLPVLERHAVPFRVGWLEPPVGFDAAIQPPDADLRFVNASASHLLLINTFDSLRGAFAVTVWAAPEIEPAVVLGEPLVTDITAPGEEIGRPAAIPPGRRLQIGWRREGATASLRRSIVRPDGQTVVETLDSHYVPAADVFLDGAP